MKKVLLILILTMATTVSCKKGGFPPRNYNIEIQITDSGNNDLVKGIGYTASETNDYEYYPITQYNFSCVSKTDDVTSYDPSINPNKELQTIILFASTPPYRQKFKPAEIKFEVVCPHIFKDNEKHEIITKWTYPEETTGYCTGVVFEGVEYIPVSGSGVVMSHVDIVFNAE